VNVDSAAMTRQLPPMISAESCARQILAGVGRNRGLILVGGQAAILWRLHRLFPRAFEPLTRLLARRMRRARGQELSR
jgi:hypothetical protein